MKKIIIIINILIISFIFYKNNVKIFLKWIFNQRLMTLIYMTFLFLLSRSNQLLSYFHVDSRLCRLSYAKENTRKAEAIQKKPHLEGEDKVHFHNCTHSIFSNLPKWSTMSVKIKRVISLCKKWGTSFYPINHLNILQNWV